MADERRLTTRMTAKWSALSREGRLPRHADFDLEAFGADGANCVVIALTAGDAGASTLLHVGAILRNESWSPDVKQTVADYPANSLLRLATAKIPALLAKRGPITFGGTGVRDFAAILYRAILLPLYDDGQTIDHVIGSINFREITAVQEYAEEGSAPVDKVSSSIAFSSRKVAFAPAVAKKPMQITIK